MFQVVIMCKCPCLDCISMSSVMNALKDPADVGSEP